MEWSASQQVSPHLPLGHAAVVLGSLLQELLAPGLSLLLQAALPLQLLELQVLKLLGLCFQRLSVLKEAQQRLRDRPVQPLRDKTEALSTAEAPSGGSFSGRLMWKTSFYRSQTDSRASRQHLYLN